MSCSPWKRHTIHFRSAWRSSLKGIFQDYMKRWWPKGNSTVSTYMSFSMPICWHRIMAKWMHGLPVIYSPCKKNVNQTRIKGCVCMLGIQSAYRRCRGVGIYCSRWIHHIRWWRRCPVRWHYGLQSKDSNIIHINKYEGLLVQLNILPCLYVDFGVVAFGDGQHGWLHDKEVRWPCPCSPLPTSPSHCRSNQPICYHEDNSLKMDWKLDFNLHRRRPKPQHEFVLQEHVSGPASTHSIRTDHITKTDS
jgi:hypothetical protein